MKKTMSILTVLILLIICAIGIIYNRVWLFTLLISFFIPLIIFFIKKTIWTKTIVIGVLILAILVLAVTGQIKTAYRMPSYSRLKTPFFGSAPLSYVTNADRMPTAETIERSRIERRHFEELAYIIETESAGVEAQFVGEAIDRLRDLDKYDLDLSALEKAHNSLENSISGFGTPQQIKTEIAEFQSFLNQSLDSLRKSSDHDLQAFAKDFEIQVRQFPIRRLNKDSKELNYQLEKVVSKFAMAVVNPKISISVKLNIDEEAWILEEKIYFHLTEEDPSIVKVNATELTLETKAKGLTQTLSVSYGDQDDTLQKGPEFNINPFAKDFSLTNRIEVPAKSDTFDTVLKPLAVRYLSFRWPEPFPARLKVTVDLSSLGLTGRHSVYATLKRDQGIEYFYLPKYSYFSSSYDFSVTDMPGIDKLRPDKDLRPNYFQTHKYIWIEILPRGLVSRNPLLQRFKAFLLAETLIATLIVALVASFFAALLTPTSEREKHNA